jgi:hypothetical protein
MYAEGRVVGKSKRCNKAIVRQKPRFVMQLPASARPLGRRLVGSDQQYLYDHIIILDEARRG